VKYAKAQPCGAQIMRARYTDDVVTGLVEGGTSSTADLGRLVRRAQPRRRRRRG